MCRRRWGCCRSEHPDCARTFRSLRGVDSNPGNLRPAITSLIGRDAEVSNLQAALRSHRLVTLAGVGGVGKTRLALEVATQLADEFVDGVWFFELAAVADPAAVPDAVAAVLGITQQPGKSVGESVASALEGRSRLLVFDNCEHVVDSVADLVAAILAASATVKVLATSREGIGVADEFFWRVPSLDVGAAVELFFERAQSMVSDPLADEATAVADVCRRLDGIPLAIELAASRMASMTAAEVRDRLDDRFKLLVGSRRGLERHQTLRHAVAWSYDLLDDAEKTVLERCSVFAGGFDLQSACAVAGFDDADDYAVLDRLDALVRKSLLVADRSSGRTRFSMLETIRQFAEEQLVAGGEATEVRTAHARYFARRETDILALWDSPRQRDAYDWFTAELANLRTAFRWAADHGNVDDAATVATFATYLGFWVENYEPIAWAEELIEPARAVDHPRLASLYAMASQCYMVGRIKEAVRYSDAGQQVLGSGRDDVPDFFEGWLFTAYMAVGPAQPDGRVMPRPARTRSRHPRHNQDNPGHRTDGGRCARRSDGRSGRTDRGRRSHPKPTCALVRATRPRHRFPRADPDRARDALRRGLVIAQDSGNRNDESHLA